MLIWRCLNPNCKINNVIQEDHKLILENKGLSRKTYDVQCGNCLKKYTVILDLQLEEMVVKDRN